MQLLIETHLSTAQHYDAEIAKYFHNYIIHRADRDTKYNSEDCYQLLSGGGCVLLSNFSYDNCELLITECAQLKLIVGTLYRRPLPNFTLRIQLKDKDTINVFTNVINSFRL